MGDLQPASISNSHSDNPAPGYDLTWGHFDVRVLLLHTQDLNPTTHILVRHCWTLSVSPGCAAQSCIYALQKHQMRCDQPGECPQSAFCQTTWWHPGKNVNNQGGIITQPFYLRVSAIQPACNWQEQGQSHHHSLVGEVALYDAKRQRTMSASHAAVELKIWVDDSHTTQPPSDLSSCWDKSTWHNGSRFFWRREWLVVVVGQWYLQID